MTKLSEMNWALLLHGTVKCNALSSQFPVNKSQMSNVTAFTVNPTIQSSKITSNMTCM
jgi:hypothetical protein